MKSYFILDCPELRKIQDSLFGYYRGITANNPPRHFWTHCTRQQLKDYFSIPKLEVKKWFDSMNLRVRDMSFTVWDGTIKTFPHTDEPPVVAKINVPVLNTTNTFNVWFDERGNQIDRVECTHPIVFRSDIPHTVEVGANPTYPRIQFSFCFYDEPLHLLGSDIL